MPITEQLQTSEQLQQAGLPRAAAVLLAEKIEAAAQATHDTALDRFRTELRSEISALTGELHSFRAELHSETSALEARMSAKFADVSAKFADVEKSIRTSQTVLLSASAILLTVTGGLGTAILTVLLKR